MAVLLTWPDHTTILLWTSTDCSSRGEEKSESSQGSVEGEEQSQELPYLTTEECSTSSVNCSITEKQRHFNRKTTVFWKWSWNKCIPNHYMTTLWENLNGHGMGMTTLIYYQEQDPQKKTVILDFIKIKIVCLSKAIPKQWKDKSKTWRKYLTAG